MTSTAGITFSAWRGSDFVSLVEVLISLGHNFLGRDWTVDGEFAPGWSESERLNDLARSAEQVTSLELIRLLADGVQLVDGEIVGRSATNSSVLTVRSVRGDEWDVMSTDEHALAGPRKWFGPVAELPIE